MNKVIVWPWKSIHSKIIVFHNIAFMIQLLGSDKYDIKDYIRIEGKKIMLIAVCDDEEDVRELLAGKIRRAYPDAGVVLFRSGEELLRGTQKLDILFLDIQMPGKDGMETAREFRGKNKKTAIIFVTAIEEYVFQAFDVGAFHYLVKPVTDEKFISVLENAVSWYREQENACGAGKHDLEEKYLMIKTGGVCTKVLVKDIVYAEVFNRKITIHKIDGDIEYYGRMSELERQAGEDFFRSHRAYLVHLKYVERYDASTIYLEKGMALMSKGKYKDFVRRYLRFCRGF